MKQLLRILGLALISSLLLSGCSRNKDSNDDSKLNSTLMGSDSDYYGSGSDILTPRGLAEDLEQYATPENFITSVHFAFDSSAIDPNDRGNLDPVIEYLKSNNSNRVLIEGRCDWYGTAEYNLGLGDRRSCSVKNYLTQMGASDNQIETVSKGSLEATQGLSKEEASKDRRADIYRMK
jgi:peptidoglycan-associated lipoprotein